MKRDSAKWYSVKQDGKWRPFPLGVLDWQASKALSLAIRGLGWSPSHQRFYEHLGVNVTHFQIALTPFSTWRVRLKSIGGALPRYRGSGAEPQPPTFSGAFGCEWNSFLNSVNNIFNSACQTGKRQSSSQSLHATPKPPPPRQSLHELKSLVRQKILVSFLF